MGTLFRAYMRHDFKLVQLRMSSEFHELERSSELYQVPQRAVDVSSSVGASVLFTGSDRANELAPSSVYAPVE